MIIIANERVNDVSYPQIAKILCLCNAMPKPIKQIKEVNILGIIYLFLIKQIKIPM